MPLSFEAHALLPSHRYLLALLFRFRRFVNRSVANMLATRERQARRLMLQMLAERRLLGR
jgi:hypothetical protein